MVPGEAHAPPQSSEFQAPFLAGFVLFPLWPASADSGPETHARGRGPSGRKKPFLEPSFPRAAASAESRGLEEGVQPTHSSSPPVRGRWAP